MPDQFSDWLSTQLQPQLSCCEHANAGRQFPEHGALLAALWLLSLIADSMKDLHCCQRSSPWNRCYASLQDSASLLQCCCNLHA